jgi:hypothetical protein
MIKDDIIKNVLFNKVGNNPTMWKYYSENLSNASKHLNKQYSDIDFKNPVDNDSLSSIGELTSLSKIVNMLRAMAIECLFKALWLKCGEKLAINGEFKKIPDTRNHNLVSIEKEISKKIDLNISENENDLLKELSYYNSHGRYPIPTKWSFLKKHINNGLENKSSRSHGVSADKELFDDLEKRLTDIFNEIK